MFKTETKNGPSQNEKRLLEGLREKGCVFLPPEKDKGIVAMDKSDYVAAALEHLNTDAYEKVKSTARSRWTDYSGK